VSDSAELTNPMDAPESIVYKVMESTENSMTLEVAYTGGFWTFKLVTADYVASEPEEPILSENYRIEAEDWTRVVPQPREVVLENASDIGGGKNLGYIDSGDWMEYDFDISDTGNYELALRVASQSGSSPGFRVSLDDVLVDQIAVPNTGGWQNWQTVSGAVIYLDQGSYTLRLEARSGGANINWIEFIETDEQADSLPVVAPPITASDLSGSWKLAPEAGALTNPYWFNDAASIDSRSCLFDDLYVFNTDNSFINQMGSETWLEPWQGGSSERCDTPVSPHDGAGNFSYVFDESAMTITLNGTGAHIGIPKVINGSEIASPSEAPDSIVYDIIDSTATTMTLNVNVSWADWTFKLVKESDVPAEPLTESVVTVPELQADTQHVYVSEKTLSEGGDQVTVKLSYLADNPNTTGIGFRVNYDSNIFNLNNVSDVFSGAIASGEANAEGNALDFGWASLFGQFPGSTEAELATITFDITEGTSGSSVIDISETSTAAGYFFDGQSHNVVISP
jgi:hypothetical protein